MGIEAFFNSLYSKFDIIKELKDPEYRIQSDVIFFDFNSIIHTVSSKSGFYFTNDTVVDNVCNYLLEILSTKYVSEEIKLVYISIDGIPCFGKIIEQKKRRYIGELWQTIQSELIKKYELDVYPNYFNKNQITPGTKFMFNMVNALHSSKFYKQLKTICPKIEKFLISDDTLKGEGEFKIVKFIKDNMFHLYGHYISVYSPDADMILLLSLLPYNRINILRYGQDVDTFFRINVGQFKYVLTDFVMNKIGMKKTSHRIVADLVFIFTFFGNDFLPKLVSYNVRDDLFLIMKLYCDYIRENSYILDYENGYKINMKNFVKFMEKLEVYEEDVMKNKEIKVKKQSHDSKDKYHFEKIKEYGVLEKDMYKINRFLDKYKVLYNRGNDRIVKENEGVIIQDYITGLKWLVEYYFNYNLYEKWYFRYNHLEIGLTINKILRHVKEYKDETLDGYKKMELSIKEYLKFVIPKVESNRDILELYGIKGYKKEIEFVKLAKGIIETRSEEVEQISCYHKFFNKCFINSINYEL